MSGDAIHINRNAVAIAAMTCGLLLPLAFVTPGRAEPVTFAEIVNQTDWTQAGVGGAEDSASVEITLSYDAGVR
jgi:hypothetical protein